MNYNWNVNLGFIYNIESWMVLFIVSYFISVFPSYE